MKITVDAQALASALQRIASIPGRSALPILGSVLIAAEGSSLTLTAYNPFSSVGAEGILRDAAGTPAVVVMRPKKRLAGGAVTVTHGVAGAGERGRGRDPEAQQPQMEFHRYANCINQDMEKGRGIGPV